MSWDNTLNFVTHDFAKGPMIFNMVMTFVLTSWSHITLSLLLEGLSVDFPSHMIVSMLDIYKDIVTIDKLIFPLDITCILAHAHVPIPSSLLFPMMGVISKESLGRSVV